VADQQRNNASQQSKKNAAKKKSERRRHIAAIVMIVASIVSTLSIFNYSTLDEAVVGHLSALDIFRYPFNSGVRALVGGLHNHLGLIGALTAEFFVNSTVGFFSIVIPLLVIVWGWVLLRKNDKRIPVTITNYGLVFALELSATMGIATIVVGGVPKEWSGSVGGFLADIGVSLLGSVGAPIIMLTVLFITVVLAIDLDLHKSLDRAAALGTAILALMKREPSQDAVRVNGREEEEPELMEPVSEVMIRKPDNGEKNEKDVREEGPEEEAEEPVEEETVEEEGDEEETEDERPRGDLKMEVKRKSPPPEPPEEPLEPPEVEDEEIDYVFPSVELLDASRQADVIPEEELKATAELVRAKLANFDVAIESVSVTPGPVVTLYELVPASGVKISRIVALSDDLALALAAKGIRIMAPIPGKSAVGIEIPNKNPSIVHLRGVINSQKFRDTKAALPIAFGKTISGDVFTDDLSKMPHLLIAGSTGSGKSVGINTILASLLFRMHPSEVKFVIIDPKKIELTLYSRLRSHFLAVSPDIDGEIITTPENAVFALKGVELEMERRYDRLAAAGVRNIADYNERIKSGRLKNTETVVHRKMPYLIVVIDELADLMITAAREVEEPIARLAQLARAVGVHLVLATQRPSVDVITGVIKANFPARIAYQVASKIDSRTILDMNGAEQLLGAGDMLYLPAGSPKPVRIQNAFISTDEVERLTEHIERQQGYKKPFTLPSILEKKRGGARGGAGSRDELFDEAAHIIVRHQQGSVSLLQRRLKVGYSRAARLVDELEAAGIVGPFDGSKARDVLVDSEDQLDELLERIS
jgi:DNA segregation ATPase FtsK/SpoIIIE, S-DNA-T family